MYIKDIKENKYLVGISVIDILGTKGVWKSDPTRFLSNVTYLFDKYNELVNSLRSSILEPLPMYNLGNDILINFKTFSDTVFIIFGIRSKLIEESNPEMHEKKISSSCGIILLFIGLLLIGFLNASFQMKLYFRASLGLGTIYKNKDIIIGPAIDEAAEDYEQSNWVGVSLTPSASIMLNKLLNKNNLLSQILGDLYIQYDLPKKKGIEKNCFVLNWPKFFLKEVKPDSVEIIKNNLKFDSDQYMDYNIYIKYKTTIDFCERMSNDSKYEIKSYFHENRFKQVIKDLINSFNIN